MKRSISFLIGFATSFITASASAETRLLSLFRGLSPVEQALNLEACKQQALQGEICVTSHQFNKLALYDVALITSGETDTPKKDAISVQPSDEGSKDPQYLSNGSYCYHVDSSGNLYGSRVKDEACHVSYRSNGSYCYNVDAHGSLYGNRVEDSLCHVSYRSNGSYCYNVDVADQLYGNRVDDQLCRMGALSNGSYCYRTDVNGTLYGNRLPDDQCHVSYRSNGSYCYNVDAKNQLYGTKVKDALCSSK